MHQLRPRISSDEELDDVEVNEDENGYLNDEGHFCWDSRREAYNTSAFIARILLGW